MSKWVYTGLLNVTIGVVSETLPKEMYLLSDEMYIGLSILSPIIVRLEAHTHDGSFSAL